MNQNTQEKATASKECKLYLSDDECDLSEELLSEGDNTPNSVKHSWMSKCMQNSSMKNKGNIKNSWKLNLSADFWSVPKPLKKDLKKQPRSKVSYKTRVSKKRINSTDNDESLSLHNLKLAKVSSSDYPNINLECSFSMENNTTLKQDISMLLKWLVKQNKQSVQISENSPTTKICEREEAEGTMNGYLVSMKHIECYNN